MEIILFACLFVGCLIILKLDSSRSMWKRKFEHVEIAGRMWMDKYFILLEQHNRYVSEIHERMDEVDQEMKTLRVEKDNAFKDTERLKNKVQEFEKKLKILDPCANQKYEI